MNNNKPLSKYQRKQMTDEEIERYENTDDSSNYVMEYIEHGGYWIELIRLAEPDEYGNTYHIDSDIDGEYFTVTEDAAREIVLELVDKIDETNEATWEEDEDCD